MPNSNYQRGRRAEWRLCQEYRARGWEVARTAGSHGPWDVVARNPKTGEVHMVQVKSVTRAGRAKIQERMTQTAPVTVALVTWVKGKGWA